MGNDIQTNDADEAMEIFLKREFPQILARKSNPHDVIFIPDSFNHRNMIEKVCYKAKQMYSAKLQLRLQFKKHMYIILLTLKYNN